MIETPARRARTTLAGARAARALALALGGVAIGCAGDAPDVARVTRSRAAITNGVATGGDAATVGIAAADRIYCSGVVVSPHVVLTAAHCLVGDGERFVAMGSAWDPARAVRVARAIRHPDFIDGVPDDDLGVVVAEQALAVTPTTLASAALQARDVGGEVRIVGFGRSSATDGSLAEKRTGTARIADLAGLSLRLEPNPSNPCHGDSGGPVFMKGPAGAEALVAIVSSGDDACAVNADAVRLDHKLTDFLAPLLARAEGPALPDGAQCLGDGACASGTCASFPGEPAHAYCTAVCAGDTGCLAGWRCAPTSSGGQACRSPDPEPGALGSLCARDVDCASGYCAASATGATCATLCFASDPRPCPDGFTCVAPAGASGAPGACLPSAPRYVVVGGGCTTERRGEAGSPWALALLGLSALTVLRMRRGRVAPATPCPHGYRPRDAVQKLNQFEI
jgi:hypothetical protein